MNEFQVRAKVNGDGRSVNAGPGGGGVEAVESDRLFVRQVDSFRRVGWVGGNLTVGRVGVRVCARVNK